LILNEVPKLTPSAHQVWFLYKCYNKVDWRERCETPAGKASLGRPRRRKPRRLPDRPRKASACSGNPLQIVQAIKKTGGKLDFFKFVYSLSNSLIRNASLNELTDALLHYKGAVISSFSYAVYNSNNKIC